VALLIGRKLYKYFQVSLKSPNFEIKTSNEGSTQERKPRFVEGTSKISG